MTKRKTFVSYFLIPAILVELVCGIFLAIYGKVDFQLGVHHRLYSTSGAWWMELVTQWGEAYLYLIAASIAIFKKRWRLVSAIAATGGIVAIVVAILKHLVFEDMGRPMSVITFDQTLLPLGSMIPIAHSFPSGHTTTAFAFFSLMALTFKRPTISVFALLAAIAVGFSRVYLMMHWVGDVMAGAALGTAIALLVDTLFTTQKKAA